jgi:hypothetical protein
MKGTVRKSRGDLKTALRKRRMLGKTVKIHF